MAFDWFTDWFDGAANKLTVNNEGFIPGLGARADAGKTGSSFAQTTAANPAFKAPQAWNNSLQFADPQRMTGSAPFTPPQQAPVENDPLAAIKEQLLAILGQQMPDYASQFNLDFSGMDQASDEARSILSSAEAQAMAGIDDARARSTDAYGNASDSVQQYYNTHVNDLKENAPGRIAGIYDQAGDAAVSRSQAINESLGATADKTEALRAELMGSLGNAGVTANANEGGNALREGAANISELNAIDSENAAKESVRAQENALNGANVLANEGGQAVGNIEALLAGVLSGYDSKQSDVQTAFAQQMAGLSNDYAAQKLQAELTRDSAVMNAGMSWDQMQNQNAMGALQGLYDMQTGQSQAQADAFETQQNAQSEADDRTNALLRILLEQGIESGTLTPEQQMMLMQGNGLNINR